MCQGKFLWRVDSCLPTPAPTKPHLSYPHLGFHRCLVYSSVLTYRACWCGSGKDTESHLRSTFAVRKNAPDTSFHSLVGSQGKMGGSIGRIHPKRVSRGSSQGHRTPHSEHGGLSDVPRDLSLSCRHMLCHMRTIFITNQNTVFLREFSW